MQLNSGIEERNGALDGNVECSRWVNFAGFLQNLCFNHGLDLSLDVKKRWLRQDVKFKIEGSESSLRAFNREFTAVFRRGDLGSET